MKIPDAKAVVDKDWEKLEKLLPLQKTKVRSKKRGHSRGTERGKDSSFCIIDGHLPPQELGVWAEIQVSVTNDGRKNMDVISRLPGCAGQAADAVSAYTQVTMEDAPKLFKNHKSECPDISIRLPRHKWPKSWSSMEDSVFPLERNPYGHPLAGLLWERQFEKIMLEHGWEKFLIGNAYSCSVKKDYSYLCMWMTSNWVERSKILIRCGKVLNKEVDLGEPTSFFDHVYLGCTQRQCETSKDIVDNLPNHV